MNPVLAALLDPKALAVILTCMGSAIAWLVKQARTARLAHQSCEIKLAVIRQEQKADHAEIKRLTGAVEVLTTLLKKEIHVA